MDALTKEQRAYVELVATLEARKAVASLCGLVLRRLQDDRPTRSFERNAMEDVLDERLSVIFGEALQQATADLIMDGDEPVGIVAPK